MLKERIIFLTNILILTTIEVIFVGVWYIYVQIFDLFLTLANERLSWLSEGKIFVLEAIFTIGTLVPVAIFVYYDVRLSARRLRIAYQNEIYDIEKDKSIVEEEE